MPVLHGLCVKKVVTFTGAFIETVVKEAILQSEEELPCGSSSPQFKTARPHLFSLMLFKFARDSQPSPWLWAISPCTPG
jgi:hypothetical protein